MAAVKQERSATQELTTHLRRTMARLRATNDADEILALSLKARDYSRQLLEHVRRRSEQSHQQPANVRQAPETLPATEPVADKTTAPDLDSVRLDQIMALFSSIGEQEALSSSGHGFVRRAQKGTARIRDDGLIEVVQDDGTVEVVPDMHVRADGVLEVLPTVMHGVRAAIEADEEPASASQPTQRRVSVTDSPGLTETHMSAGPVPSRIFDMPIEQLELSQRTYYILTSSKIIKVGQILQMSENELLSLRNFGQRSLNELREKLLEHGVLPEQTTPTDKPRVTQPEDSSRSLELRDS